MRRTGSYSGKGGRGTKKWGDLIEQAVEEGKKLKAELELRGCKFEPAHDGTLGYIATLPDGTTCRGSVWEVRSILVEREGG